MAMLDTDAAYAIADLPDVFTWKGKSYQCVTETSADAHANMDEGIVLLPTLNLTVRTALFNNGILPDRAAYQVLCNAGGIPKTHDEIIYDGQTLHVKTRARAIDGVTIILSMESYMAGATHG